MKNLFTIFLFCCSSFFFAQAPVVEGTYLPVKGTSVKEVWDTTNYSMSIPSTGINQVWDYTNANNQFTNIVDTFQIKTMDPALTPYSQYFSAATHASYLRTPFNNPSDSLFSYFIIDHDGVHNLGGFNTKAGYDSTITTNPSEFYLSSLVTYPMSRNDTAKSIAFGKNISGFALKIKQTKYKLMNVVGYGTLMMPNANYNNVLLAKEDIQTIDSIYVDFMHNGNYTYYTKQITNYIAYAFIRNNTFGSSYLMHLSANATNTMVDFGWYALPVDFGSISGTVFTDISETTPVTDGEAYLYRENSNFAKNDILVTRPLDSNGNYHFDSIPYGEYRVAIRPTVAVYPNALITYFGDTTNWIDATPIITNTLISPGHNIHIQYHAAPSGAGAINGQVGLDYSIMRTTLVNPIPGIGIVVKKNPGGNASRQAITDAAGGFSLGVLDDGNYELFVDIPGLFMAGTYSFTISGGTVVNDLDFTVGSYSIHPTALVTNIKENTNGNNLLQSFPNPYTSFTNINVNLTENSDVLLEVYNLLGEKVQTLERGTKQAGNYKYTFCAKKLNYASGMYVLKLNVGTKTSTLKIIEQ